MVKHLPWIRILVVLLMMKMSTVLYDDGQVPYYFKKVGGDDTEYTIGGPINMDVGVYEIFITDDPSDNYIIVPDPDRGILSSRTSYFNCYNK